MLEVGQEKSRENKTSKTYSNHRGNIWKNILIPSGKTSEGQTVNVSCCSRADSQWRESRGSREEGTIPVCT